MMNHFHKRQEKYNVKYYKTVSPIKLTEGRNLKLYNEGWGLLTDFYLESVKINKLKNGKMSSIATLKIGDSSGHIICVIKGAAIGLLFNLTPQEWQDVEKLNNWGDQLFYRYFKSGIKNTFNFEQKLFYHFCMSNQTKDILAAVFRRATNCRNVDKNDAVLEILDLRKCNELLLDIYLEGLQK